MLFLARCIRCAGILSSFAPLFGLPLSSTPVIDDTESETAPVNPPVGSTLITLAVPTGSPALTETVAVSEIGLP